MSKEIKNSLIAISENLKKIKDSNCRLAITRIVNAIENLDSQLPIFEELNEARKLLYPVTDSRAKNIISDLSSLINGLEETETMIKAMESIQPPKSETMEDRLKALETKVQELEDEVFSLNN